MENITPSPQTSSSSLSSSSLPSLLSTNSLELNYQPAPPYTISSAPRTPSSTSAQPPTLTFMPITVSSQGVFSYTNFINNSTCLGSNLNYATSIICLQTTATSHFTYTDYTQVPPNTISATSQIYNAYAPTCVLTSPKAKETV